MTASNYPNVLPVTLVFEGGKVNDPHDPGGRTNEGVTQRVYDSYRKKKGLATRSVYLMENAERDEIYETLYWRPSTAIDQPNGLDMMTFDGSVNSGNGKGKAWLAKAKAGGGTVAAQITRFADVRLGFLHGLGTFSRFGKGWTSRVAGVEAKSQRMAAATLVLGTAIPMPAKEAVIVSHLEAHATTQTKLKIVKTKATATATATTATVAPVAHAAGGHWWIVGAIVAVAVATAVIGAVIAWQHSVRADAMTAEAATIKAPRKAKA